MSEEPAKVTLLANKLAEKNDSDVFLYNGDIGRPNDRTVSQLCTKQVRRSNITLVLVTLGGDADAGYRIARCLQDKYAKFTIIVSGACKSAGTIVAIGADEVVMSDNGELGPLDVQMAKPDELWQNESGLNIDDALDSLRAKALQTLEEFLIALTYKSGSRIRTVTALETARDLVIGLYGKIFEQIDPIGLGEASRATKLAVEYGNKLNAKSKNLKQGALDRLGTKYPHHGFVIDRKEAESLFVTVRNTNELESELIETLGPIAAWTLPKEQSSDPLICFLSDQKLDAKETKNEPRGETDPSGDPETARRTVSETGKGESEERKISAVTELPKQTRARTS